jgi:5-methylthioadenosine/S-adenosylhomocysteine deaminase
MITKVKGKYVIGFKDGEHIIYKDGEVVYKNDTIVYVGKDYNGHVDKVIDEGNCIVSPGFVDLNALGDINHDLFFNEFPKGRETDLQASLDYFENHRKEEMSQEEENYKSLYAYAVLIMN